jgi:hypothetical protein
MIDTIIPILIIGITVIGITKMNKKYYKHTSIENYSFTRDFVRENKKLCIVLGVVAFLTIRSCIGSM